ncbi:glutathione S-transferase [Aliiglaciecola sp. 3_MG-2023]|uniref:glutathione S-transferase family protein n=1 Tax=Aliiglaciecola sp. 3_MG-2023 TaxID=3062644 RepID=UPI0026E27726|nr:glutathione S-transferase [Aliiglaciecola sp. 3_MG-2023]MDO6694825.1 glutathione S-transferase [Aliiglaciecola sp. 3_MG-2023]
MLKLYGFAVSNYFNMVKMAAALKQIDCEDVITYPNQTPEYLAISPTGKVPALETNEGVLVETNVILEYLDENYPGIALYPKEPFQKARVKELVKMIELYMELPARRCHAEAFWGVPGEDITKKEVKRALLNGIQAISRAASFSPYIGGEQISAADIVFLYSADLAAKVAAKLFAIDLLAEAPGAKELLAKLNEMPEAKVIAQARAEATPAFNAYLQKAFQK